MAFLTVLLQYNASIFTVDTLITLYSTSKSLKSILNNKHYLKGILDTDLVNFTFKEFINVSARSFLSTKCFNYYSADKCAKECAKRGNLDILKLAIEKGANNWSWIAKSAAEGGHLDILTLAITKGANNWNWIAGGAAKGGHLDILNLLIEKGANDWNWIAECAKEGDHLDIISYANSMRSL